MEMRARIDGWKVIAAHFGRDRTTVMRWAAERGLPVQRLPGGGSSSVYAYVADLNAWLAQELQGGQPTEPEAPTPQSAGTEKPAPGWRSAALAGGVIGAMAIAAGLAMPTTAPRVVQAKAQRELPMPSDPALAALYVQAREDWASRTASGLHKAVAGFGQIVARDPRFAPAYGGLADSYLLIREFDAMPEAEAYAQAEAAARAALAIDPGSMEAERALGFVAFWHKRDNPAAAAHFNRALALEPRNGQTRLWLGNILIENAQVREGLAQLAYARLLDPASRAVQADHGWALWASGDRAKGRALLETMATHDPDFVSPHAYLGEIALIEGDGDRYVREAAIRARLRGDATMSAAIKAQAAAFAAGGMKGLLGELAAQARATPVDDRSREALIAALAGDRVRLLALLRDADRHDQHWSIISKLTLAMNRFAADAEVSALWRKRLSAPIVIAPSSRNGTL